MTLCSRFKFVYILFVCVSAYFTSLEIFMGLIPVAREWPVKEKLKNPISNYIRLD